jgi:hypothetical protein
MAVAGRMHPRTFNLAGCKAGAYPSTDIIVSDLLAILVFVIRYIRLHIL